MHGFSVCVFEEEESKKKIEWLSRRELASFFAPAAETLEVMDESRCGSQGHTSPLINRAVTFSSAVTPLESCCCTAEIKVQQRLEEERNILDQRQIMTTFIHLAFSIHHR